MNLAKLLSAALGRLQSQYQYGLPLAQLLQSQINHDPSHVLVLADVDDRGTEIRLQALGKQVQITSAFKEAIGQYGGVELDDDQGGGFRFTSKGMVFTLSWRKRTSEERIKDTVSRVSQARRSGGSVQTPTGRLTFPSLIAKQEVPRGTYYEATIPLSAFMNMDFSTIEERAAASMMVENELYKEIPFQPVNCRCQTHGSTTGRAKAKKPTIDLLPTTLKNQRRENTLPRDMQAAGGIVLPIVGSSYRTEHQQKVFKSKNPSNMVLVAHEPDNPVDKNALAVFAWDTHEGTGWNHVGYLQKALNRGILDRMVQMGGGSSERIALKGVLLDDPAFEGNPRLRLTEVWSFPTSLRA